jgi:serine/threonine protein kinase
MAATVLRKVGDNRNVVRFLQAPESPRGSRGCGVFSLVMELCSGGSLLEEVALARRKAEGNRSDYQAPTLALHWLLEVTRGLDFIHHHAGLLHRGLTASAVVLSAEGVAKISSFAQATCGPSATALPSDNFPVGYSAPEVFRVGLGHDHRADLYSLGVLAWVVLTGGVQSSKEPQPPVPVAQDGFGLDGWEALTCWQRFEACLDDDAYSISQKARDFIQRLTQREPERRMKHDRIRRHSIFGSLVNCR